MCFRLKVLPIYTLAAKIVPTGVEATLVRSSTRSSERFMGLLGQMHYPRDCLLMH